MDDYKYMSGAGNTFYIGTDLNINSDIEVISYVADSIIEIDGVISVSINKEKNDTLDMDYYNSDGSKAELCVNGVRCASKYAYDNKYFTNSTIFINTPSGLIQTLVEDNNIVSSLVNHPFLPNGVNEYEVLGYKGINVDVGNPHFVIMNDDIYDIDIEKVGNHCQNIDMFPNGTNIEFYSIIDKNNVNARVFERGVGETSACGSGAIAIYYVLLNNGLVSDDICLSYPGGKLNLKNDNNQICLSGEIKYL